MSELYWDGYELEYARNMLHVFPRERMFRSIFNPGLDLQQQGYTFLSGVRTSKNVLGLRLPMRSSRLRQPKPLRRETSGPVLRLRAQRDRCKKLGEPS